MKQEVIIIGGGAAGISAACALATEGVRAVILEQGARLGGRAASFFYPRVQEEVDYGQHILMRCCRESIDFFSAIGQTDAISFQPHLSIPVAGGSGTGKIASSPLPGALHLLPSLLSYTPLSLRSRLRAAQAVLPLLLKTPEDMPFDKWLDRHGQRDDAIAAVWDPICVATLNAHTHQVSTHAARMVFERGFFRRHGADIGLFTRPLSQIFAASVPYLSQRGCDVRTRTRVGRILLESGAVSGVELVTGEKIMSKVVIAAIPPHDFAPLIAPEVSPVSDYFARVAQLLHSVIVNVHLWYDQAVMEQEFVMGIDSPLQAVFNVTSSHSAHATAARFAGEKTFHIVISQSAAADWMTLSTDAIKDLVLSNLPLIVPGARAARPIASLVLKSPRATFVPAPGSDQLRLSPRTPIGGLVIAGDHIDTGWPATIEGAVRSGRIAAACALESLQSSTVELFIRHRHDPKNPYVQHCSERRLDWIGKRS